MDDPEYDRLSGATERMIDCHNADDTEALILIWENFTIREQRMVIGSLVAMVAAMRTERGDPPSTWESTP
jgi:hypothetical protein